MGLSFIFKPDQDIKEVEAEERPGLRPFDIEGWLKEVKEAQANIKTGSGYWLGLLPSIHGQVSVPVRSLPKELNPVVGDVIGFSEALLKSGGNVPVAFVEAFGGSMIKGVGGMVSTIFKGPESIFKVYNTAGEELKEKEGPGELYRFLTGRDFLG